MVKEHIEEYVTLDELKEKYQIGVEHIKYMIALYKRHGEGVFSEDIQKYSDQGKPIPFKKVVLKLFTDDDKPGQYYTDESFCEDDDPTVFYVEIRSQK